MDNTTPAQPTTPVTPPAEAPVPNAPQGITPPPATPPTTPVEEKKKMPMLLIIVVILLFVGAIGGAVYYFMFMDKSVPPPTTPVVAQPTVAPTVTASPDEKEINDIDNGENDTSDSADIETDINSLTSPTTTP